MKIKIEPSRLTGTVSAIPSKSDAHRLIIAALLSQSKTVIRLPSSSDDIEATLCCVSELGATVTRDGGYVTIDAHRHPKSCHLNCRESGSTLRFIVPVASAVCETASFSGGGRLPDRPIIELLDAMRRNGVEFSSNRLPFTKSGLLKSGVYELPGNVSSQYITGLLFALPLLDGNSEIKLTTKLESAPYIDITLWALKRFGIEIEKTEGSYLIKGNQRYISPGNVEIDGDWSNASYFLGMGLIGNSISMTSLDTDSPQGDKKIIDIFRQMGGKIELGDTITAHPSELHGCEINISEIPDMFPTLAVLASSAKGTTRFVGGARLRIKESDRIATTARLLRALGARVEEYDDGMEVVGGTLVGGEVDGSGDHRIVMAAALASCICKGSVTINGAEAVNKSYPSFFEDFEKLGGNKYYVI